MLIRGLDTSVLLQWLKETTGEVIAFCANVGQEEELDGLEEKALSTGASKCFVDDLQEEFARDFIFPMMRAGAIYEGQYFLGTSIARPLIAKRMVEIARAAGAGAVAHGATGKGNDQVLRARVAALAPELRSSRCGGRSFRESSPDARDDRLRRGARHPGSRHGEEAVSMDRNLLHISYESGILEDPWFDASDEETKDTFRLRVAPEYAPDQPEMVELRFEQGNCTGIVCASLWEMLESMGYTGTRDAALTPFWVMKVLNRLGGKHGIGRVDMVENRFVGMKSRGVYETPGGAILHFAHRQMESLTMDREVMHLRDSIIPHYSTLVYNGFWFAPERHALQALVEETQKNVTGEVRLKLFKGNVIAAGRRSPVSLYNPHMATMEADPTQAYNQSDATGFIRRNALRLKVAATLAAEHGATSP